MEDIEKLVKALREEFAPMVRELCADDKFDCDNLCAGNILTSECIIFQAASALASLLTENERLRAEFAEERAKTKKLVDSAADLLLARDRLQAQVAETRAHDIANTRSVARLCGELSALRTQLAASQRREQAAVEDILDAALTPCTYCKGNPINGGTCDMRNDHHDMFACWQWRGPRAGKEETE